MGVMLTLDRRRPPQQMAGGERRAVRMRPVRMRAGRGRPGRAVLGLAPIRVRRGRYRGQHQRSREEQACLDAFAAFLRCDAPGAGRTLSRLATGVLSGQLLPAARALADAVDVALSDTTGRV
jgi:hypothetical protein